VQLLKRIGRCVEVASREVEIHRRVRQVGVTEQELNRAQVRTRFQQMCGIGVPERVRRDAFVDAGLRAARRTASQITLLVIGASARQPLRVPGKR
jgi:hypothetical protein